MQHTVHHAILADRSRCGQQSIAAFCAFAMCNIRVKRIAGPGWQPGLRWSPGERGNDGDAEKSSAKNMSRNIFRDFCRAGARPRSKPPRAKHLVQDRKSVV